MPIIFASTLAMIPTTIAQFFPNLYNASVHPVWSAILGAFSPSSWAYAVIYFVLIIAFNYFYVAIQYKPPLRLPTTCATTAAQFRATRPGQAPPAISSPRCWAKLRSLAPCSWALWPSSPLPLRLSPAWTSRWAAPAADCGGRGRWIRRAASRAICSCVTTRASWSKPCQYFDHVRGTRQ